jgi:hypothetical protein
MRGKNILYGPRQRLARSAPNLKETEQPQIDHYLVIDAFEDVFLHADAKETRPDDRDIPDLMPLFKHAIALIRPQLNEDDLWPTLRFIETRLDQEAQFFGYQDYDRTPVDERMDVAVAIYRGLKHNLS